ncbi:hypothetical protein DM02DRAFT_334679 [Periconia macrospinosa]|uniref:Metallothionein n=1 Tax=Periconia macrospinosa TaxID=97972 RepID=A0A2V1DX31_9PLEO|nr:hypothetical protein DM02DRAFT_334679 [Periconia macrospinosa]
MRFSTTLLSTLLVAVVAANPIDVTPGAAMSLDPRTVLIMRQSFGCNCGESSCSGPACCANGSCRCNCGESGCDAASPPCCANGSC